MRFSATFFPVCFATLNVLFWLLPVSVPGQPISEAVAEDLAKLGQRLAALDRQALTAIPADLPTPHEAMVSDLAALAASPPWAREDPRHLERSRAIRDLVAGGSTCRQWELLFSPSEDGPRRRDLWHWTQAFVLDIEGACADLADLGIGRHSGPSAEKIAERLRQLVRQRLASERARVLRRARLESIGELAPETGDWLGLSEDLGHLRTLHERWRNEVRNAWSRSDADADFALPEREFEEIMARLAHALKQRYMKLGGRNVVSGCGAGPWCPWTRLGSQAHQLYQLSEVRSDISAPSEFLPAGWILELETIPNRAWNEDIGGGIRSWAPVEILRTSGGVLEARRRGAAHGTFLRIGEVDDEASHQSLGLDLLLPDVTWRLGSAPLVSLEPVEILWTTVQVDLDSARRLLADRGLPGYARLTEMQLSASEERLDIRYRLTVPTLVGSNPAHQKLQGDFLTVGLAQLMDRRAALETLQRQGREVFREQADRLSEWTEKDRPRDAYSFLHPWHPLTLRRLTVLDHDPHTPIRVETEVLLEHGPIGLPLVMSWSATRPNLHLDHVDAPSRAVADLAALYLLSSIPQANEEASACRAAFHLGEAGESSPYGPALAEAAEYFARRPNVFDEPSKAAADLERRAPEALRLARPLATRIGHDDATRQVTLRFEGALQSGLPFNDLGLDPMGFERSKTVPRILWLTALDDLSTCRLQRLRATADEAWRVEIALAGTLRAILNRAGDFLKPEPKAGLQAELDRMLSSRYLRVWDLRGGTDVLASEVWGKDLVVGHYTDGKFLTRAEASPKQLTDLTRSLENRWLRNPDLETRWVKTVQLFDVECWVTTPSEHQDLAVECPTPGGHRFSIVHDLVPVLGADGLWRPALGPGLRIPLEVEHDAIDQALSQRHPGLRLRQTPILQHSGLRLALRYQPPGYPFPVDYTVSVPSLLRRDLEMHLKLEDNIRRTAESQHWGRRILGLEETAKATATRVHADGDGFRVDVEVPFPLPKNDLTLPLLLRLAPRTALSVKPSEKTTRMLERVGGSGLDTWLGAWFEDWPVALAPADPFIQLEGGARLFIEYSLDFEEMASRHQPLRHFFDKAKIRGKRQTGQASFLNAAKTGAGTVRGKRPKKAKSHGFQGCGLPRVGGVMAISAHEIDPIRRVQASWPCVFPIGTFLVRDPSLEYDLGEKLLSVHVFLDVVIPSNTPPPFRLRLTARLGGLGQDQRIEGIAQLQAFQEIDVAESAFRLKPKDGTLRLRAETGADLGEWLELAGIFEIGASDRAFQVLDRDANVRTQARARLPFALSGDMRAGMAFEPWRQLRADAGSARAPILWGRGRVETSLAKLVVDAEVWPRLERNEIILDPRVEFSGELALADGSWVAVHGRTEDDLLNVDVEGIRQGRTLETRLELTHLASLTPERLQEALLEKDRLASRAVEPLEVPAEWFEDGSAPAASGPTVEDNGAEAAVLAASSQSWDAWTPAWSEKLVYYDEPVRKTRKKFCWNPFKWFECQETQTVKIQRSRTAYNVVGPMRCLSTDGDRLRRQRTWFRQPSGTDLLLTLDRQKELRLYRMKACEPPQQIWRGSTDQSPPSSREQQLALALIPVIADRGVSLFEYGPHLVAVENGHHLPTDPREFLDEEGRALGDPKNLHRLERTRVFVANRSAIARAHPRAWLTAAALRLRGIDVRRLCASDKRTVLASADTPTESFLFAETAEGRRFLVQNVAASPHASCDPARLKLEALRTLPTGPSDRLDPPGLGYALWVDAGFLVLRQDDPGDSSGALFLLRPGAPRTASGAWRLLLDGSASLVDQLLKVSHHPSLQRRLNQLFGQADPREPIYLGLGTYSGAPRLGLRYTRDTQTFLARIDREAHADHASLTDVITFWNAHPGLHPPNYDFDDFQRPWPFLELLVRGDWRARSWSADPIGSLVDRSKPSTQGGD